ncbi:sulfotransferase domain-containing protein [Nisaea acidiphila]|uniref:Sulfotransferase domain-containing protein n=1 Tax=Nisaea acidiphila TaxID=1862145 RepID=A0A9J7ATP8_9PROT|nr:sulfotransferase domain-containing protein [Nisaea acidiphila]UUX49857.1 sulfotransferase domain-containing protein [Nisaea acidiphila]
MSVTTGKFGEDIRKELEDDYRVFYVTAWGYAADHYFGWLPKALNSHREIFALLAHEGSRPKYLKERLRSERPELVPFTEFLNDMGMTYAAIGDCYSYRAMQFAPLLSNPTYSGIPVVNLLRHPVVWLEFYIRWRAGNMRMRAGASDPLAHEWRVASHALFRALGLKEYDKNEIDVWAAYQGMTQLGAVLSDLNAVQNHVPIEQIIESPELFQKLVRLLTKEKVIFEQEDLDRAYEMVPTLFPGEAPVNANPRTLYESWPGWKVDAFRKLVRSEVAEVYRRFGYDLFDLDKPGTLVSVKQPGPDLSRPIFVSSLMKAGTWLVRGMLEELTGLKPYEPEIRPGQPDYADESLIDFPAGHFFSWHMVLTPHVEAVLRGAGAHNFFIVRNVFDLILSMYNHLQNDVDAALGRSVGGAGCFNGIEDETAIAMVINGFSDRTLTWRGLSPHLKHMESLFQAASKGLGTLITYEGIVVQKSEVLKLMADRIGLQLTDDMIARIEAETSVEKMQERAVARGNEGHFRSENQRQPRNMITENHVNMVRSLLIRDAPELGGLVAGAGLSWLLTPLGSK